jgi:hypothetical protein
VITPPREPIGKSLDSRWLRDLLRYTKSLAIKEGVGYRRNITSEGTLLSIDPGAGGGSQVKRFRLKEVKSEYLVCRTWDGTTEGDSDVNVAKSPKLRCTITEEGLDGVVYEYAYTSNEERTSTDTDDNTTESQRIVPRFLVDDEIFAISCSTGVTDDDDAEIGLMDLNLDARAWAAQSNE